MKRHLAAVTLVVPDYDEAIDYYVGRLGFHLVEDTPLEADKRWVFVAPSVGASSGFLLAKAATQEQTAAIGAQTGGRVFLFLHTDNFYRDYNAWKEKGVEFTEAPREESYGTVVVFRDLFGNKWDLIQPKH